MLVNPTAGAGRARRWAAPVAGRLRAGGADVRVVTGTSAEDALERTRAEVVRGADAVVALGGDGCVSVALRALAGTGAALGVVAAGTGDDAARWLGLPRGRGLAAGLAAADVVLGGRTRRVDLGLAHGRPFLGVLSCGLDARVSERAARMRRPRGRLRYDLAVLAEVRTLAPERVDLDVDGTRWSGDALLVAVGNGPSYGGGLPICPGADPADGLLDVTVVRPVPRRELLRMLPALRRGEHVRHPAVSVHRGRRVALAAPGAVAYADGERVGPLPVAATVDGGALRVLVGGRT